MEKIIHIDNLSEEDLVEKYNDEMINHDLVEYILKKTIFISNEDSIKIILANKCNTKIPIKEKIIEGLKLEYEHTIIEHKRNNLIQLFLLLLGIIFLFLSTKVSEDFIWKEILLIGGWVPIWEMVDIELFKDFRGRRTKKVIEKLIKSDIKIEN